MGGEVSRADRDELTRSARVIHDYAVSIGLPNIERSQKFYIYGDLDALIDAAAEALGAYARDWNWQECGYNGGRGWGFFHMCDVVVTTSSIIFHLAQSYVDEIVVPRATLAPEWLRKGFDGFFGGRALALVQMRDYHDAAGRSAHVEQAKESDRRLKEMETWADFYFDAFHSISSAFLAAELLASRAGESSLMRYYTLSDPGTDWRATFRSAFGLTVDEFYALFEAHRAAGFPAVEIRKTPPAPIPTVAPEPIPHIAWEVGDGVSQSDLRVVMSGIRVMHNYAERVGLPDIGSGLRFYVYADLDALTAAYAKVTGATDSAIWQNSWYVVSDDWAFIYTSSPRYASLEYGEHQLRALAAQLHYAYQNKLAQERKGAAWLSFGSAEFASYRALSLELSLDPANHRHYRFNRYRRAEFAKRVDAPLRDMESWADFPFGDAFSYSMMAAELLASRAGESAILRYYALLTPGTDWRDAFQDAFGLTVDEFYALFEAHRAAGFPEVEIPAGAP